MAVNLRLVRQITGTTLGTIASIGEEGFEEKVERFWREMPPEQIKKPEGILQIMATAVTLVPAPLRKGICHGLVAGVKNAPLPDGIKAAFSLAFAPALIGTSDGIGQFLDANPDVTADALAAELKRIYRERNTGGAGVSQVSATADASKAGIAGTLRVDGGRTVHKTACTACEVAKAAGTNAAAWSAHGSILDLLPIEGDNGNDACRTCFREEVGRGKIVVEAATPEASAAPAAPAPASAATTLGVLAGLDPDRDRAFALLARIIEVRKAEVIVRPRGIWSFLQLERKGGTKQPELFKLLPKIDIETDKLCREALIRLEGYRRDHGVRRAKWPLAPAPGTTLTWKDDDQIVSEVVDEYDGYMAKVRFVAEKDVFDGFELAASALDYLDDKITDELRENLLDLVKGTHAWWFMGIVAVLIALSVLGPIAATGIMGVLVAGLHALITFLSGGLMLVGGVLYVAAFTRINLLFDVWFPAGYPAYLTLFVGIGFIVAARFIMTVTDKVYDGVGGTFLWVKEAYNDSIVAKALKLALSKVGVEALGFKVPDARERIPSSWWMQTGTVFTIIAFIGWVLSTIQFMAPNHIGGLMIMVVCALLGLAAEMMKKWGGMLKFDRKVEMFESSFRLVTFATIASIVLLVPIGICSGIASTWIGDNNVASAQKSTQATSTGVVSTVDQKMGETFGLYPKEVYPNSREAKAEQAWVDYCAKYPWQSQCQIRRRNGLNP